MFSLIFGVPVMVVMIYFMIQMKLHSKKHSTGNKPIKISGSAKFNFSKGFCKGFLQSGKVKSSSSGEVSFQSLRMVKEFFLINVFHSQKYLVGVFGFLGILYLISVTKEQCW